MNAGKLPLEKAGHEARDSKAASQPDEDCVLFKKQRRYFGARMGS